MGNMVYVKQLTIYCMHQMALYYKPWKSNHSNNRDKAIHL